MAASVLRVAAVAALLAVVSSQKLDIWGGVDETRRECYGESNQEFWNPQGYGHYCEGYVPPATTFPDTLHAEPEGTYMPGFGFEYDKYQVNEINGVGWSMHLDYVAEVGASTTEVIRHIGGFPNCNATATGRANGATYGSFGQAVHNPRSPPTCGCNDYPIGDHNGDTCYPDCWEQLNYDDYYQYSNGWSTVINGSVCESSDSEWGQIYFGQNTYNVNDEYYWSNFRSAAAVGQAMNKDSQVARASVEDDSAFDESNDYNNYKTEAGRADVYVGVYDYPLQVSTNRYRFRFRFAVRGSDKSVYSDANIWDDNYINQMMTIRSLPLDGEPCNNDGPEVEGIEFECNHFEPQIQARVSIMDGGVTPELHDINWLYGDEVNNDPSVSYSATGNVANWGGSDAGFFRVQKCTEYCTAGQSGQAAEIFTEHEGDNHYINIIVPSAPDASCSGCAGSYDLRGVAFRAMDITFAGAASNVASMLLVAVAAVLALFAM